MASQLKRMVQEKSMRKLVNSSFFVYLYYITIGTAGQRLYVKTNV